MNSCSIVYVGLRSGVKWLNGDFSKSQALKQSSQLAKLQKQFEEKHGSQKEYKGEYEKLANDFLKRNGYKVVFNDYTSQLSEAMTSKEADEFVAKLKHSKEVKFKFKKVEDGSIRKARGTLDPETIKKGLSGQAIDKAKKKRAIPDSIIIYWDLDKEMFRSFRKQNFLGYL